MINKQRRFKNIIYLFLLFSLVSLVSCAGIIEKPKTEKDALRERVMLYWNYKVKGDFGKAYFIEYPLYRKQYTLDEYKRVNSNPIVKYKGYELLSMDKVKDGIYNVGMKVYVRLKVPGAKAFENSTILMERWVRDGRKWYHVPGRRKVPSPERKKN